MWLGPTSIFPIWLLSPQIDTARTGYCLRLPYAEKEVEHIAELDRDPNNWRPAGAEAWERGRLMAGAIADSYTDEDWRTILKRLGPSRAAQHILSRPPDDHNHLLELVQQDRRVEVQRLLTVTAWATRKPATSFTETHGPSRFRDSNRQRTQPRTRPRCANRGGLRPCSLA